MEKFNEPMFKVIRITSQDVISTSIINEDVDNQMKKATDIFGIGEFQEENIFISG